ncbi:hypothetical protein Rxycam_01896 [Rubrobacter xylanophilus DSM 9941]|uniref:hypothetical protein n=1 Tax=Rubrobacter xylanophilus TaxID=49319 RepID=UPI001C63C2DA|nr:hypothetical protein [Rubrobacter xylanophilus]QYJ16065.1 hypothetical protein Rxycam_01896 [Rubrobacter xylanophilus DSM 9941]
MAEGCLHLEGLRVGGANGYVCPVCGVRFEDLGEVRRWVREAERARDEAYSLVEGDGFGEIALRESQREVYRRRRVMYELENAARVPFVRPEMVLVMYDGDRGVYECRVFYKEPRPANAMESFAIGASQEEILEFRSDPNPIVRLLAEKVEEFHQVRGKLAGDGAPAPERRVFYSSEL